MMSKTAGEKVLSKDTGLTATDLTGSQYLFVTVDAEDAIALATAGEEAYVLVDAPAIGQHGTYATVGKVPVFTGAAVSVGDPLTPDAAGKAVAATTADIVCGLAVTPAAGADELIEMQITAPVAVVA